ncbi:MAG: ABC transporter ATP-binding protein, partial [Lachnospiraceae bacterium]|nr:ABC transporter ATP-binding protein [Lachnospiraceae bacterium]
MKGQKETLRKVLKYIKRYKWAVIVSIILAAVTVATTLYVPILTGDAVDLIVETGNVDMPGILKILLWIGIIMLVTAVAQWLLNTCNNYITYHVIRDIRKEAFHKLEILPLKYLDTKSFGDIVSRVIADVDTFAEGLLMGFTQLFTGVLTIGGTLLFMLATNIPIALVVVCITPVSFLVAKFIASRTYSMFKEQTVTRGEQTGLIEEMVGNQKVVKAFAMEQQVQEQFEEINGRLEKCSLKAIFFSSLTNPCTRFVNSLVYAGVGIFGALLAIGGGISVGRLSCFLSYANQYTKPFNEISGVITELQNALVCAARIFELIEEEPQIPDAEDARVLEDVQGHVDLQQVSFSYVPERKLIQNLNLKVEPGQRVAIVGPTGCGKTTLINLLMRFYDVNEGSIRVDGTDIRNITRGSLRTSFGMVLQETWLKVGTIRENIAMGNPDATLEEVIAAAKAAHAHSFI